jgi:PAS domain S-box-containing protein
VNEMALYQYGYSRTEFLTMTAMDIWPDANKETFKNSDLTFKREHPNSNGEIWNHIKKDGTIIQEEIIAHEILFEGKEASLILSKDITEKVRMERRLISSEKRVRKIIENIFDMIILMDASFKIIYRSPSASRLTGWNDEDLSNSNGVPNIHPDDLDLYKETIQNLVANPNMPKNATIRYQHKDGHYIWIEGTGVNLLNDEDVNAIVFNFRDVTARIQEENNLIASEKRLRALIENNYDSIALMDESLKIIFRSPSATRISGWTNEEIEKIPSTANVHPDDLEKVAATVKEVFANPRKPIRLLYRNLHKNGKYIWLEGVLTNLIADRDINAIILNFRDITDKVEADEKLIASELHFRLLIENSVEGISLADKNANTLYRSPSGNKIFGTIGLENTINRTHPDDLEMRRKTYAKVLRNPGVAISFQSRILHSTNRYIWLEGTFTNLINVKGINAIVTSYREITKRKELEVRLKRVNKLARIGGWEIDMATETVYWTNMTREIHETEPEYLPDLKSGLSFFKKGKDRDLITQKLQNAIELGTAWDLELQICTTKNNKLWIRTIGETEFKDGKCVRVYGSIQDIDKRKKAEEQVYTLNKKLELRVKQRTEELESFSYSVSHDLRAPLRAVNGYAKIIEEDYGKILDTEGKRLLLELQNNAQKMGLLIDELLAFSRLGRKDVVLSLVDMDKLTANALVEVQTHLPGPVNVTFKNLIPIQADHNLMKQVLINLLSNALKYSSKKDHPEVSVESKRKNGMVVFSVKDNGAGFNMKYSYKLFGVFQRLHSTEEFPGIGVGLAILKLIIQKHKGKVWAEGKVGQGATFYFSLPDSI